MGKYKATLKTAFYLVMLMLSLAPFSLTKGNDAPFLAAGSQTLDETWPGTTWATATPQEMGMDPSKLEEARNYALSAGGSGMVIRGGVLVMRWGSTTQTYDLKSAGKSIGMTALGLAMQDGLVRLEDLAGSHHPNIGLPPDSNLAHGWLDEITIHHLATMTAGFDKHGGYTELLFRPGSGWAYSDGGPNWLAEALTLVYQQDLYTLLAQRVFTPLGIPESQLSWRDHYYRPSTIDGIVNREFGGISASVDAMVRLGLLYLRGGRWNSGQILDPGFVQAVGISQSPLFGLPEVDPQIYPQASEHYGLMWWNNADGSMPNVPRDAYWAWGLYESLIVVIPSLDIVATRASWGGWQDVDSENLWTSDYQFIQPFIEPIAQSVALGSPYKLLFPLIQTHP
jgi:CubicO group peptidase (beta-lactamase class C family)